MSFWDQNTLTVLREQARKGLSGGQIALKLGVTRNSVIGKAYREGIELKGGIKHTPTIRSLKRPARPPRPPKAPREVRKPRSLKDPYNPLKLPAVIILHDKVDDDRYQSEDISRAIFSELKQAPRPRREAQEAEPVGVAILDLESHHCRWPLGDRRAIATHFCGARKSGPTYCEAHEFEAYAAPTSKASNRPSATRRMDRRAA